MDDETRQVGNDEARAVEQDEADHLDTEYDRELDAAAVGTDLLFTPRPCTPCAPPPPPVRVPDRQVATLTPGGAGEFLRACRAAAALSQRQAAEAAGVAQSTWARIEAGRVDDVRLLTLTRLAEACGVTLVGTTATHDTVLTTDLDQRHRDHAGRWLPAHLANRPRDPWAPSEWMFPRYDRATPQRRYSTRLAARDLDDQA